MLRGKVLKQENEEEEFLCVSFTNKPDREAMVGTGWAVSLSAVIPVYR
jgi:hypothetical protein